MPGQPNDEARVREVIADWAAAVRTKDVDGVSRTRGGRRQLYLAPPLQYVGRKRSTRASAEWFATFPGPIGYDVTTSASRRAVTSRYAGASIASAVRRTNGEKTDVWVRATIGCRRVDDTWLITHEHASVPFLYGRQRQGGDRPKTGVRAMLLKDSVAVVQAPSTSCLLHERGFSTGKSTSRPLAVVPDQTLDGRGRARQPHRPLLPRQDRL